MNTHTNNAIIYNTVNRLRRFRPHLAIGLGLSLTAVFCLFMFRAQASHAPAANGQAHETAQFFADKNKPAQNAPLATLTCDTASNVDVEATAGTLQAGYATLSAAIAAINAGTHQGVINVEICANVTETAAMFLNSNAAAPAAYTSVNIYPLVDSLTISGPTITGRGLIELNGADGVTIDGDNPLTVGTNRNLTITNTAATTVNLTSAIRIAVIAAVPTADNITIRNLNVNGNGVGRNVSTFTSTTNVENSSFAIYAGGLATGATTAPGPLTSVSSNTAASGTTINAFNATNNAVNACARGIFFNGAAAAVSTGVTISNNLVGDQSALTGDPPYTTPATTVYTKGIFVAGTTAYTITGNSVRNVISYVATLITGIEINTAIGAGTQTISGNTVNGVVSNSVAGTSSVDGIIVSSAGGPYSISGNTVTNVQLVSTSFTPKPRGIEVSTSATSGTIEKNRVSTVYNRSTGTGGSYGINLVSGNNITVQNNFVWDINENMTGGAAFGTTFGAYGIRAAAGTGHKIYHNSVNLFGTLLGTANSSISTAAFVIVGTGQTGIDVRNNIFSNTLTGGTTSIAHVAMFLPSSGTSAMNLTLNNNDYNSGTTAGVHGIAHVGTTYTAVPAGPATFAGLYTAANFSAGAITPTTNLRAYTSTLSAAGTNDNATKVVDPLFVSATDLHIQSASPMESMGTNLSVADDIDNEARGGSPDIGADEITLAGAGTLQFSAASYTNAEGTTATITVNRTGGVTGALSVMYATSDNTATAGVCGSGGDYVATSGTLNWANGDSAAKTFTVTLCNDLLRPEQNAPTEATETVNLTLSNPMGTTITGTNPATLNITDNPPGTIQFSAATFNGTEGAMATITATRTLGSFGAVSVAYATSDGTATGGTDYTSASGTLNWADGDSASKTFTVPITCDTTVEGTETVNLTLSAPTGGAVIGATNPATLNIADAVGACAFCNADGPIAIPSSGVSAPYPSVINVSGAVGTITSMRVTLNNIQHTDQTDIDILLVGPGGQKFILMSDAGDSTGLDVAATLTFDDAAAGLIPTGAVATGSYRPTNVGTGDTFAAPAPIAPYLTPASAGTDTLASAFGGGSPNGTWSLYVVDDAAGDVGTISGWCLDFMTVAPNPGVVQFSATTYAGNEGTMATITATRTGGNAGAVSVDYATSNGSATAGTCGAGGDYVAASGTLNWADMDIAAKTFTVTLCTDAVTGVPDASETVNLTLSTPTGMATIGLNNPAVLTITDVPPPLSGSYNVPGDYSSLTNATGIFAAMNTSGVAGAVTINIAADLTGENGGIALNENAGAFPVTIKPSGAPRTITGSSTTSIIRLNGADNVTINGSTTMALNVVGGTPALRELTVENTNTGTGSAVISVQSGPNGASNNTIKNVNVDGQAPTTTLIGISMGGNGNGVVATVANNNNRVENCRVRRATFGIYSAGLSAAVQNTGTVITENDLSATVADRIRRVGIVVFNESGVQITQNSVGGMQESIGFSDAVGIGVGTQTVSDTNVTAGGVSGALVARNQVNGVSQDNTGSAVGIAVAGSGTNTLQNNMITGVISDGNAGDLVAGIYVVGAVGSTTRLYNNSVSMTGDRNLLLTPGTAQFPSYGIAITGTDPTVELKNNIFYTTQTADLVTSPAAFSYGIGMVSTTFVNLDSNFNIFFSSGANDMGYRTASLGNTGGVNTAALVGGWQTLVSDDANSLDTDPFFINPLNDLHLDNSASLAKPGSANSPTSISPGIDVGTPIASVTDDFDGAGRGPTSLFDIGGDEVTAPTASGVTVSGRVLTSAGRPIRFARLTLASFNNGETLETQTDEFGNFIFDDNVEPGATYSLTVSHPRYIFSGATRVFSIGGDLEGVTFVADKRVTRTGAPEKQ